MALVNDYYHYIKDNGSSDNHQNNILKAIISFANFVGPNINFTDINRKEQIISFLSSKIKSEAQDPDKKWITTWNDYLGRIKHWSNKAMVLYLQGSNEEALRDIDKSISIVSKHEHSKLRDFFYIKAIILFGLRKYEQSKEWFDKTTAIDSRFSLALSGNAAALARMGYKEKSIKLLHDAIEIDSHNYNAWYNLGVMYEIDAKYHQALLHYNRSIEINQHNYASFTNRGRILDFIKE